MILGKHINRKETNMAQHQLYDIIYTETRVKYHDDIWYNVSKMWDRVHNNIWLVLLSARNTLK